MGAAVRRLSMVFVDTNIFIRFLTKDDPIKAEACYRLFERARQGTAELTTSESVLAEVVFILASKRLYNLSRQDVRMRLYPLFTLRGLKLPNRAAALRALDLYSRHTIDFEDALSVAIMEQQRTAEIYSYNTDFDGIRDSAIRRIEP